jgi:catechol 2,3-dioxygenase-like lactoylglutathione lyase family enzyme
MIPVVSRGSDLNHVSVGADDLEASIRFYEDVLGLERVPTPNFGLPVQWLRAGEGQLHLFEYRGEPPARHHFGLTVRDLPAIYERAKAFGCLDGTTFSGHLVELPGDLAQLYLRDPAGNLVELDAEGASTLPEAMRAELVRLADVYPQTEENLNARLPLG